MVKLKLDSISMEYTSRKEKILALKDISFEIYEKDFLVIVGPSGCGKSTLLNIIAGFLKPSKGKIEVDGVPIKGPGADRGVVFQKGALFQWLSVRENIEFGLKAIHMPEKERNNKVDKILEVVGLDEFANSPIYNVSGGMRQRVALARCLVMDPNILLMDEPLGALDALTREKMQGFLLKIWEETSKTIIFITHSVEEAIFLGSKLYVMSSRPGEIIRKYELSFSRDGLYTDSRKIKTSENFIKIREEILHLIWGMEENLEISNH